MRLNEGDVVPDIRIMSPDGVVYPGAGGLWVLIFFKLGCEASLWALGALDQLYRQVKGSVSMLGVFQGDGDGAARIAEEQGLVLPIVADGAPYRLSRLFDPALTPTTFVIDGNRVRMVLEAWVKKDVMGLAEHIGTQMGRDLGPVVGKGDGRPAWTPG